MHKSQTEPSHELENQFILRLPPEHVSTVRKIIHSGCTDAKDKLKINLYPDKHQAIVQVEDVTLAAKLVDLPCVVGSLKTLDRKTFYKTADISQMLVCTATTSAAAAAAAAVAPATVAPAAAPAAAAAEESSASVEKPTTSTGLKGIKIKEKNKRKKYIWKHGITPPLKNVRKKRFRKTKKHDGVSESEEEVSFSEFIESPDVEKEVKRLLCSDAEALSTRWEVVTEDESNRIECQGIVPKFEFCSEMAGQTQGHLTPEYDTFRKMSTDSGSSNDDELEHGRGNKDDDEDEDEDEDDDEEEDDSDSEEKLEALLHALGQYKAKKGTASMVMEIQKQIYYVEKKLKDIQKKARKRGNLLKKVENLALRNHLKSVLKQLKLEENQKCEQLIELQKQLKRFLQK
ncbi:transcription initiation factor TFIID subunit 7-like [Echinops telfairi]|uniref:Transcription initiation factor TFIID subunit 7-like n=1 Tax=Echinops telfairi TaxID=9371 RepID=A0AC55D480_ECHTE|nr:transcription initiation factor TFIID subunit 7-like [Echinops telfairi]